MERGTRRKTGIVVHLPILGSPCVGTWAAMSSSHAAILSIVLNFKSFQLHRIIEWEVQWLLELGAVTYVRQVE